MSLYLTDSLFHFPPESRQVTQRTSQSQRADLWPSEIILFALRSLIKPATGRRSRSENLLEIGKKLSEFGSLPMPEYREILDSHFLKQRCAELERLESLRTRSSSSPRSWHHALEGKIAALRKQISDRLLLAPEGMIQAIGLEKAEQIIQHYVLHYGQLLMVWPEIYKLAIELRTKGIQLAKPVGIPSRKTASSGHRISEQVREGRQILESGEPEPLAQSINGPSDRD